VAEKVAAGFYRSCWPEQAPLMLPPTRPACHWIGGPLRVGMAASFPSERGPTIRLNAGPLRIGLPGPLRSNSQAVETLHQQHGPVAEYGYPDRRDIQSELDQEGQADMFVLHAVDRSIPLGSAPICGLKICVVGVVPSGLCQRSCHQRRV
jgi:hypothetical protein